MVDVFVYVSLTVCGPLCSSCDLSYPSLSIITSKETNHSPPQSKAVSSSTTVLCYGIFIWPLRRFPCCFQPKYGHLIFSVILLNFVNLQSYSAASSSSLRILECLARVASPSTLHNWHNAQADVFFHAFMFESFEALSLSAALCVAVKNVLQQFHLQINFYRPNYRRYF